MWSFTDRWRSTTKGRIILINDTPPFLYVYLWGRLDGTGGGGLLLGTGGDEGVDIGSGDTPGRPLEVGGVVPNEIWSLLLEVPGTGCWGRGIGGLLGCMVAAMGRSGGNGIGGRLELLVLLVLNLV